MLTREEVLQLIKDPKILNHRSSQLVFDVTKFKNSFELVHAHDKNKSFKVDYKQSKQVSLKLSCHHRDSGNTGLVRVDYNGPRHKNPETITPDVPAFLHPYCGFEIGPRINHIHIYVETFGLDWAIPLNEFSLLNEEQRDYMQISQLVISNSTDKNKAVKSFAELINLNAQISFTGAPHLN